MGNHVSLREIVAEEQVFEAERADEDQNAGGDARLARALNEQRVPRDDGGNAPRESVDGTDKREQKCKRAEYIHKPSASPPKVFLLGVLHAALLGRAGSCGLVSTGRRFVLGSAFGLNVFRDELAV